jgi:hypothetical protein
MGDGKRGRKKGQARKIIIYKAKYSDNGVKVPIV